MGATIHHGDCIEIMRSMPTESVDAIVTSPPYAMQRKTTYGGIAEKDYPAWTVAWMAEARRLLKPDGSVIINIRPHLKDGQISDYVLRSRLALRDAGWNECEELIWYKSNPMPTGSLERPRRTWESLLWFAKHGKPWVNIKANGKPSNRPTSVQTTGQHVGNGWGHVHAGANSTPEISRSLDVVIASLGAERTGHPAPFPPQIAEWAGRLTCPPSGTVLDPFSGSASTGIAAIRNGWEYIGIEAVAEYVEMSRVRLAKERESAA